jgi:hypothetical protein
VRNSARARKGLTWATAVLAALALAGVAAKVLPGFDQQNVHIIALALPLALATAIAFRLRSADA